MKTNLNDVLTYKLNVFAQETGTATTKISSLHTTKSFTTETNALKEKTAIISVLANKNKCKWYFNWYIRCFFRENTHCN